MVVVVGGDALSARDLSATVREGSVFLNFSWYFNSSMSIAPAVSGETKSRKSFLKAWN